MDNKTKPFEDMTEIEQRNKYGLKLFHIASQKIKNNGLDETSEFDNSSMRRDVEPVDLNELLNLFRSNASLFIKLNSFMKVKPKDPATRRVWLTTPSVFSGFINSGQKMQLQYYQINTTLSSYRDDLASITSNDITQILQEFRRFNKNKELYYDKLGWVVDPIDGSFYDDVSSLNAPGAVGQKRMDDAINNFNVELYEEHEETIKLLKIFELRQGVIGRGIPRKYM